MQFRGVRRAHQSHDVPSHVFKKHGATSPDHEINGTIRIYQLWTKVQHQMKRNQQRQAYESNVSHLRNLREENDESRTRLSLIPVMSCKILVWKTDCIVEEVSSSKWNVVEALLTLG